MHPWLHQVANFYDFNFKVLTCNCLSFNLILLNPFQNIKHIKQTSSFHHVLRFLPLSLIQVLVQVAITLVQPISSIFPSCSSSSNYNFCAAFEMSNSDDAARVRNVEAV